MSAVAAVFNPNGMAADKSSIGNMLLAMQHRGADGCGVWADGNVALAHRMRWTKEDSPRENLPLKSRRSGCVITCDARIDNRDELIRSLQFSSGEASGMTDSEIILAAYDEWGLSCLPKLIGDFVIVVWDPDSRGLICARDPLGVKHFYFYHQPGKLFALASEIKALFCLPGIERRLNEESIGDYMVFNFEDRESTFFQGIKRLPSGHFMVIDRRGLRTRQYFDPPIKAAHRLKGHRAYQEAFRELFSNALACRTRSGVHPVGSMLSGGLDSSSITCVAGEHLRTAQNKRLHTFSVIYPSIAKDHPAIDELFYMKAVIKWAGSIPHFINCDNIDPLRDMGLLMHHADNPVGMANMHVHLESFKEAKRQNVRVLLDGTDGDTTVSHGYEAFADLARRGRWLNLFKQARHLKANMPAKGHSIENLGFRMGLDQVVPAAFLKPWYSLTGRDAANRSYRISSQFEDLQWKTVSDTFRQNLQLEDRYDQFNPAVRAIDYAHPEAHWRDLTGGRFARILEVAELASQAYGLEMRFPFFDSRLIDFCSTLPSDEKIYNGWTRSIFRHAMAGTIPEEVRWRTTKGDLGAGMKLTLNRFEGAAIERLISNPVGMDRFYNIDMLRRVYERFKRDPFKAEHDCLVLVSALYLASWMRANEF